MDFCKKNIAFLVTLCLFGAVIQVKAQFTKCRECMDNLAYCVNETSYYICYDGINPSRDALLTCGPGTQCTGYPTICEAPRLPPVVACTDECSKCDTNQKFTCVSKTRYALCVSGKPAASSASCGTDEICSLDSIDAQGHICIPQCAADYLKFKTTCSNDDTTTAPPTTTASTPKPDTTFLRAHCAAACLAGANSCYTRNPTDNLTCKSYLYCEKDETGATPIWDYVILNCKTGIWDDTSKKCDTTSTC